MPAFTNDKVGYITAKRGRGVGRKNVQSSYKTVSYSYAINYVKPGWIRLMETSPGFPDCTASICS